MSKEIYKQCRLGRSTEDGSQSYMAYIPVKFAKVGKWLLIGEKDGEKEEWQVLETFSTKTIEELDRQRDAEKRWKSVLK